MIETITYDYELGTDLGKLKFGDVFDVNGNYIDTSIDYEGASLFCDNVGYLYYFDTEINDTIWVNFENLKDCNAVLADLNQLPESSLEIIFHLMIMNQIANDIIEPRGYQ